MHLNHKNRYYTPAFTIVELLVVIVIIGILAAITIVSYTGITQKANITSLTSDLDNASKQLKLYYQLYGSYPTSLNVSNCPTAPTVDNTYCLKPTSGNTFTYLSITPSTFHLTETNTNDTSYSTNDGATPSIATTINGSSIGSPCPTGFIPVPGSGTYGTNDFCVMKYEAKQVGSTTTPTSTAVGLPWVNISQTTAIANSPNVANCTGCHLISEAEWMTIAQNVLSVPSNWSGGAVGSGYIPRGNSNSSAAMDNTTDLTGVNKRTLTLTNGQVILDMASNVWEWTTGTVSGGQPGVTGAGWSWREWNIITNPGTLAVNATPSGTGLSGANTWNSANDIGQIYSNSDTSGLSGFIRGGNWGGGGSAGILTVGLNLGSGGTDASVGFRVSR